MTMILYRRCAVALAGAALALLAAPDLARADDDEALVSPMAWGVASMEWSGVGYVALKFGAKVLPEDGTGGALVANMMPAVIGAGVGFAAYHYQWDDRPGLAAHGALWGGLDMLMLGYLIEGRNDRTGLADGTTPWMLGAAGALVGGAFGAMAGDHAPRTWLTAPVVGTLGGGLIGGVWVLFSGDIGGDRTLQQLTIGAVGGLTIGMVAATVIGFMEEDEPEAAPRDIGGLVPQVEPSRNRVVFSLGGVF